MNTKDEFVHKIHSELDQVKNETEQYRVTPDGHCPDCHASIAGCFEKFAGQFGRRRTPISVRGIK